MKYAYTKVSTSGQDLSAQIHTLKEAGYKIIYQEKSIYVIMTCIIPKITVGL